MTYEEKRRKQRAEERNGLNRVVPLEALEQIAIHHFPALLAVGRATHGLDTLDSDELDFFEVSVWGLKEALVEAYLSGHTKGLADAEAEQRESLRRMKQLMASHEEWKAKRPRAVWVATDDDNGFDFYRCSKCGCEIVRASKFCPDCGARMREEANQ